MFLLQGARATPFHSGPTGPALSGHSEPTPYIWPSFDFFTEFIKALGAHPDASETARSFTALINSWSDANLSKKTDIP